MPSFNEWVEYCFTQGHGDFHFDYGAPGSDAVEARVARFDRLDPTTLAAFIVRLFRSPSFLADCYTNDQIGNAVWFLFGVATEYFKVIRSNVVPADLQIAAFSSVATLYTELFDRVCCKRQADPDGNHMNLSVDSAVYMIWDMDCIEGAILFPGEAPYLVEPGFAVLEKVLNSCRTSSCLISALHGLGHLHTYHEKRVEKIIDDFVHNRPCPIWVREYATDARSGCVM